MGKALVVGYAGWSGPYSPGSLYDPLAGTWTPVPELGGMSATLLDDGRVLVLSSLESKLYDPETDAWESAAHPLYLYSWPRATRIAGASGFCADSVCCDAACDGPCDACAASAGAAQDGACTPRSGGPCDDAGACLEAGVCEAGACVGGAPAPDGTPCDDLCSEASTCQGGACVGSVPLTCQPPDDCHEAAACDPAAGCAAPASEKPDGARCTSPGTPDAWQPAAPMAIPRDEARSATSLTATLLLDGTVLVLGAASVTRYDPRTDTWQPLPPVTITTWADRDRAGVLNGHTATLLQDGRVLIAGISPSYDTLLSNLWWHTEIFDLATGAWTEAAPLNLEHADGAATRLLDGRVLLVGGRHAASGAELYDPVFDLWHLAAPMNEERPDKGLTATLLPDGRVLVAGGGAPIAEVYDPAADGWSSLDAMSLPHNGSTATRLLDGRVLIVGGHDDNSDGTAKIYDPVSDAWTSTGAMSGQRFGHEVELLADGRVLVTGGCTGCDMRLSAEIYDPASNAWTPVPSMVDAALYAQTATRLDDGRVLVAGGSLRVGPRERAHGIANAWLYVPGQPPVDGVCQNGACAPDGGEGGAGGVSSGSAGGGGTASGGGTAGGEGSASSGTAGGGGAAGGGAAGGDGEATGGGGSGGEATGGGGATSATSGTAGAGGSGTTSTSAGGPSETSAGSGLGGSGAGGDPPDGESGGCRMTPGGQNTPPGLVLLGLLGGLAGLHVRRRPARSQGAAAARRTTILTPTALRFPEELD
ncbi:hypothetical protein WMF04_18175 [Sorangium sp. So ce260]|uniref:Kelch repeat-containing protein n=1 Tax=Sorangium sp. So ce260 TaxID=3133291 RepID=UPI003F63F9B0